MFDTWGDHVEGPSAGMVTVIEGSTRDPLPEGLAGIAPGVDLGSALASIDRSLVSGPDQVIVMQAWSRQVAHAQAELYASMVAVAQAEAEVAGPDDDPVDIHDLAASEIQAALSWTRRASEFHLGFALDLVDQYPRVWAALHRGLIDLPKARVIIDQTSHLDRENARQVAEAALERASSQTTGQLRARIQRLVISVDPDSARERYENGLRDRRVVTQPTESGTANFFGLDLPAADTNAAMRRINRLARAARSGDDPRTMDQVRADVLLDLLNGRQVGHTGDTRGVVDLQVDLTTLAGLADNPAEIPGWGPVIAEIARQVAGEQKNSEWRVTVTDPETGQVAHNGIIRRRPTASQRRHVEARHPTCIFPGCRMPAAESDIDHRRPWIEGGPTEEDNLEPLCRRHHLHKHHGWAVRSIEPGLYRWVSPLGHSYLVRARPP